MLDPLLRPVVLVSRVTEAAGHAMVAALESEGVRAWTIGGTPAEGPCMVSVVVLAADEEVARAALEVIRAEADVIDWDEVDVGVHENEADEVGESSPQPRTTERDDAVANDGPGRCASRVSGAGLAAAGVGVGAIGMRDVLFWMMPAGAKPVPGVVLVVLGVAMCIAHARRRI